MKRAKSMPDNVDDSQASRGLSKHRQLSGPSEEDNDVGAGGAAGRLPGKLLLALAVPFVPVYVYALYHLFAGVLLAAYLSFLVVYFVAVGAVVASEISICPPWYVHSTPKQGLTRHDLPDYWQGIVTDPHTEFGFAFEEVEFVNDAGMTLRGWWIPGQGERWGDTAGIVSLFAFFQSSHLSGSGVLPRGRQGPAGVAAAPAVVPGPGHAVSAVRPARARHFRRGGARLHVRRQGAARRGGGRPVRTAPQGEEREK
jgi:hypothetical protein